MIWFFDLVPAFWAFFGQVARLRMHLCTQVQVCPSWPASPESPTTFCWGTAWLVGRKVGQGSGRIPSRAEIAPLIPPNPFSRRPGGMEVRSIPAISEVYPQPPLGDWASHVRARRIKVSSGWDDGRPV